MHSTYEYDIYFPMIGSATSRGLFDRTRERLTEFFGGLTDFRHRSEGTWKYGGVTYQDEVVLLRVLGRDRAAARDFLHSLQAQLKRELGQEEILVVERETIVL